MATASLYEAEPLLFSPNSALRACVSPVTKVLLSLTKNSRFTCRSRIWHSFRLYSVEVSNAAPDAAML